MKKTCSYPVWLLVPLLAVLFGCQQGKPLQQAESAAVIPGPLVASEVKAVEPMPAVPAAQPGVSKEAEKAGQPVVQSAAAPMPVAAKPVVAKPEVKAETALSDAEGRKLAQKSGCFACHAIDKKLVGPGWKDIAVKYRGQPSAEARLIDSVSKGSRGVWGGSPMPPNAPRVSAGDIQALARFILSLK
jgi:cytochrome c